jgi:hypothetical protein
MKIGDNMEENNKINMNELHNLEIKLVSKMLVNRC